MVNRYNCTQCEFFCDVDEEKFPRAMARATEEHAKICGDCNGIVRLTNIIPRTSYMMGDEQGNEVFDSQVDHPRHYVSHASGVEPIVICRHETFNIGNAIKYIMRAPHKGTQIQDLNKARWYLADEIERLGGKIEERT